MGSRLHGNDGGGCCLGWWGWVPVFTGTTEAVLFGVVGMGSRLRGNDGRGCCLGWWDGFPSSRERRRRCCLGWWGWVPVFTGTTAAVLLGVVGMGSRLHGNDGAGDGNDGGEGEGELGDATAAVLLGVVGMGSRLHGNDGAGDGGCCLGWWGWVPAFAGTTGGVAGTTEGDGFPSSRERRSGGRERRGEWRERRRGMGSRLRGNDGGGEEVGAPLFGGAPGGPVEAGFWGPPPRPSGSTWRAWAPGWRG